MFNNTGWVLAGQGRSVDRGGVDWTNPGNVTADDGTNATSGTIAKSGGTTDWIVGDSFSLSGLVPAGNIITGIEMRVQASVSAGSTQQISSVNIGKSDSTLGTAKNPALSITTSPVNYDFGGFQDLWGLSISESDILVSTFQVRAFFANNSGITDDTTFSVDAIWVRVWYRQPGDITTVLLTTTGAQTWNVPGDFNAAANVVHCIGGGGGGSRAQSGVRNGAAGGGGAYSAEFNINLTPGGTANYTVGTGGAGGTSLDQNGGTGGDTFFNDTTIGASDVGAKGGVGGADGGGTNSLGGAGGQAASGVGTIKFSGGGGSPVSAAGNSGGGGGAAGPNGNGGTGGAGGGTDGNGNGGGGGANGGANGSNSSGGTGGAGGNNRSGSGGGSAGGGAGSNGGGGGGGTTGGTVDGGAGSQDTLWTATVGGATAGPGSGGGGGARANGGDGGDGGGYGGGGGGTNPVNTVGLGGDGTQGIIVIQYIPLAAARARSYMVF
jgi:hypothetical protein